MHLPISVEKSIADEVLSRLEVIDPTCILAGGAPRDWWLGQSCNDLDFYIYHRGSTTNLEHSLKTLDFEVEPMRRKGYNVQARLDRLYETMTDLRAVYQTKFPYKGKHIQIIVMNTPTFRGVVDKFACSISKVWYKGGLIRPTHEASKAKRCKVIEVAQGYSPNCPYVQKMRDRFPEYAFEFKAFRVPPKIDLLF